MSVDPRRHARILCRHSVAFEEPLEEVHDELCGLCVYRCRRWATELGSSEPVDLIAGESKSPVLCHHCVKLNRPISNMAMLQLMRGLKLKAVPHGMRSAFRDWVAEQTSYPRELAEAALAHVLENRTEAAYQRGDLLERRRTHVLPRSVLGLAEHISYAGQTSRAVLEYCAYALLVGLGTTLLVALLTAS